MNTTVRREEILLPVTETTPLVLSNTVPACDDGSERYQNDFPVAGESIFDDILDTLKLGIPIAISYLSWVGVSEWNSRGCHK
jgi:hypothetical protein